MKQLKVSELEFLPINLQLFADDGEDDNSSGAEGDAVDLPDDNSDDGYSDMDWEPTEEIEDIEDLPEGEEEEQEVTDPGEDEFSSPYEKNAHFRKMRLEAEEQSRKKVAAEFAEKEAALTKLQQDLEHQRLEKQIMDEHLSQQKIWEKQDEEGVSEEVATKMLKLEAQKEIDSQVAAIKQRFETLQGQKKTLQKDKYYNLLEKDVEKVLLDRPDLDFQTVYYHMKGVRSEELDKEMLKTAEKRTVANMQDRARRKPLGGSDGGSDASVNPASVLDRQSIEMSIAFGNDPRDIAKEVNQKLRENKKRR